MNFKQVEEILANSSQEDWIIDNDTESYTFKEDLNLRIESSEIDTNQIFNEPWATKHPDGNARKIDYTVKYNNSFVEKRTLVSVDGHRATLPIPKNINELIVRPNDVNFAKIVDTNQRVDEYLKRSGITVEEYDF